jgi:hypothetical protein
MLFVRPVIQHPPIKSYSSRALPNRLISNDKSRRLLDGYCLGEKVESSPRRANSRTRNDVGYSLPVGRHQSPQLGIDAF